MVDYTKSTGSSGTMRIRDLGYRIEFHLKAGSSTFNHSLPYGFTVNGNTDNSNSFDFVSGGDWQLIRAWNVSSTQTVTFRLGDSGTSGLGGPTTLAAVINRATAPSAPPKPTYNAVTATSVHVILVDGDANGADIDSRRIGWSLSSTGNPTGYYTITDHTQTISGLTPGARYYLKAAMHNSEGWSPWGAFTGVTMLDVAAAPGIVQISEVTQTSVRATFADPADTGGAPVLERQLGWSNSAAGNPTTTATYGGSTTVAGLTPGLTYYFRSRTRNSVGWSPWSAATSVMLIAGAYVKVGGVWKKAVPYVKVGGVWKAHRPWGRQFGYWEETT
jgi:hypothetical protein